MKALYKHTQYGFLMIFLFVLTGILIFTVAMTIIADGQLLSAILMISIYLIGIWMFFSFTVEVSEERIKFWFGIGFVHKSIAISDIQSIKEIKNPWYYFWGVKSIPGGWFYAIAPGSAVEIMLKNSGIVQIGSNQSEKLKLVIDNEMQKVRNDI